MPDPGDIDIARVKKAILEQAKQLSQDGAGCETLQDVLGFSSVGDYSKAAATNGYQGLAGEIELLQRGSALTVEVVLATECAKAVSPDFVYCRTSKTRTAFVLFTANNEGGAWKNAHFDILYASLPSGDRKFLFDVGAETDAARVKFEGLCKSMTEWADPARNYTWSDVTAASYCRLLELKPSLAGSFMTCPLDSLFMVYKSMTMFHPTFFASGDEFPVLIEGLLNAAGRPDEDLAKCRIVKKLRQKGAWGDTFADLTKIDECMGRGNPTRSIVIDVDYECDQCRTTATNPEHVVHTYIRVADRARQLSDVLLDRLSTRGESKKVTSMHCMCQKPRYTRKPNVGSAKMPCFLAFTLTRAIDGTTAELQDAILVDTCVYTLHAVVSWNHNHFRVQVLFGKIWTCYDGRQRHTRTSQSETFNYDFSCGGDYSPSQLFYVSRDDGYKHIRLQEPSRRSAGGGMYIHVEEDGEGELSQTNEDGEDVPTSVDAAVCRDNGNEYNFPNDDSFLEDPFGCGNHQADTFDFNAETRYVRPVCDVRNLVCHIDNGSFETWCRLDQVSSEQFRPLKYNDINLCGRTAVVRYGGKILVFHLARLVKQKVSPVRAYSYKSIAGAFWWARRVDPEKRPFPRKLRWLGATVKVMNIGDLTKAYVECQLLEPDAHAASGDKYYLYGPSSLNGSAMARFGETSQDMVIAPLGHLTCCPGTSTECGLCGEPYHEVTQQCSACSTKFCYGCLKGWFGSAGRRCPWCRSPMNLDHRVACVACSHSTLKKLWSLEGEGGRDHGSGFSQATGGRAHAQKLGRHEETRGHKFNAPRMMWVDDMPGADMDVGRRFKGELRRHARVLESESLETSFESLERVREAEEPVKPPGGIPDGDSGDDSAGEDKLHPTRLFSSVGRSQTSRMLQVVYAVAKNNRPLTNAGEFFQSLRFYGDVFGDELPGSHCATDSFANQRSSAHNCARVISYTLHQELQERLLARENVITDDRYPGRVCALPNPCKANIDTYSRGRLSFMPIMIRTFPDEHDPETTKYFLWTNLDTYGYLILPDGRVRRRDGKGNGIYNSFVHSFTQPLFLDVGEVAPAPIGMMHLKKSLVELTSDNGGGPPAAVKKLTKVIPGLPNGWGIEHHINRVYARGLDAAGAVTLPEILDALIDFSKFVNSPKKHAFILKLCAAFNVEYDPLPTFAPQRWARAAYNLVHKVTSQLRVIRFVVCGFLDGFQLNIQDREKLDQLVDMLKSHTHLFMLHWLADLLHVEAIMSEKAQKGEASAVDQAKLLLRLPSSFEALGDDINCPTLREYLAQVLYDDTGRKTITMLVLREDEEGYIQLEEVEEELGNATGEHEADCAGEREEIVSAVARLCRSEMAPSKEVKAFKHLFDQHAYDWGELQKGDGDYFKDALVTLVESLRDVFRSNGAEWVTDARFVARQASNLQRLLFGGASGVDWRGAARVSSDAVFWRRVRQHGGQVNISLVLYLRKVCLVRDGFGAEVERFISHLNKIVDDPQRRGLGNDKLEDILRINYNGPSADVWEPSAAVEAWTQVFGMRPVSSVGQRSGSLVKNQKRNARDRQRYADSAELRQKKIKGSSSNYEQIRILVSLSRGAQTEGVKKHRRKRKVNPATSTPCGKRGEGTTKSKACKRSPSGVKRTAGQNNGGTRPLENFWVRTKKKEQGVWGGGGTVSSVATT